VDVSDGREEENDSIKRRLPGTRKGDRGAPDFQHGEKSVFGRKKGMGWPLAVLACGRGAENKNHRANAYSEFSGSGEGGQEDTFHLGRGRIHQSAVSRGEPKGSSPSIRLGEDDYSGRDLSKKKIPSIKESAQ